MKKIILLIVLFTTFKVNAGELDSLMGLTVFDSTLVYDADLQSKQLFATPDTTIIVHPNVSDSTKVITLVKGVLTIATVVAPQEPIINKILGSESLAVTITTFILGLWRRRELRKLKKQGRLK